MTNTFLSVDVGGVTTLAPQLWLPRSFRSLDQAGQVDLVGGEGASQSLFLDTVAVLSNCTILSKERTRLDACLHPLSDLLRQLVTLDRLPFCIAMAGVYLTSISME